MVWFFTGAVLFAQETAALPEIMKPQYIDVEDNRLYVSEKSSISVFSLETFKLLKRFGRKGEGPGEFQYTPYVTVCPDYLLVSQLNKIQFFSKEGTFLKEKRKPHILMFMLYPLGNRFVGYTPRYKRGSKTITCVFALLDNDLKSRKDVFTFTEKRLRQGDRKRNAFDRYCLYKVFEDKIFIADSGKGFFIDVFDADGNRLYEIVKDFEKEKVTDTDKEEYIRRWKQRQEEIGEKPDPRMKFLFPEYFPAINHFTVNSGKIYAVTYKKRDNKNEVVVMDLKGTVLKKGFISYNEMALGAIYNDKYYRLRDNAETEMWELFIEKI